MTFRLAESTDAKLYFDWANDPVVRKQSHNTEPIVWENHVKWFNKVVTSSLMLIFFEGAEPVGQIRLINNLIGMSVESKHRGKGIATEMLKTLKQILIKTRYPDLNKVAGEVKIANVASIKAFQQAGYILNSVVNVNDEECNVYVI